MFRAAFLITTLCIISTSQILFSQQSSKHIDGLREKAQKYLAITNLTLIPSPGEKIEGATVIIRGNKIEAAGKAVSIPSGATIRDGKGMWCYAAFIEPYTNAGVGATKKAERPIGDDDDGSPETPVTNSAKHWNQAVKPQERAIENLSLDDKTAEEFRKQGFALLHTNSMDGIFRGSSAIVFAKAGTAHDITLSSDVSSWVSFRKGSSKTPYPSSMMGSIALIRQALLDADWYEKAQTAYSKNTSLLRPEVNVSLEALANAIQDKKTFIFETENEHSILRAQKIAAEFGLNAVYEGSGYEYRRLTSLTQFKPFLILPLNFPAVPDVSSADRALDIAIDDLKHWDAAPENPKKCNEAGLQFAFTTNELKSKDEFLKNLRKAVARGLKSEEALAALTTHSAKMLGIANTVGEIKNGYYANILLTSGDIFEDETQIRSVFVGGDEFKYSQPSEVDVRGKWTVKPESILNQFNLSIEGKADSPTANAKKDTVAMNDNANQDRYSRDTRVRKIHRRNGFHHCKWSCYSS